MPKTMITRPAHGAGFEGFAFVVEPGVFPTEISYPLLTHVRIALEKTQTVEALEKLVSGLETLINDQEPQASTRARTVLKDAGRAYLSRVCTAMNLPNPTRQK